jgi:hypothetical protein
MLASAEGEVALALLPSSFFVEFTFRFWQEALWFER